MTFVAFKIQAPRETRILVFSKTKGFRHASIEAGKTAIFKLGQENGFAVDTTENADLFKEDILKNYSAVVFLSTTGDVLNTNQQRDFERYIQAGGGYVGIHAATDTEYDWNWYVKLVGASFESHPKQQDAIIRIKNRKHISTKMLPKDWKRFDEWYNFKNFNPEVNVLGYLDETTYQGGKMGNSHPEMWFHEYDGGRAWYTAGGHTNESYAEPLFLQHILGGIKYAIGKNLPLDYSKATSMRMPEENRFNKTILDNDLDEPMELAVTSDQRVFIIERKGKIKLYDPKSGKTAVVGEMNVSRKYNTGKEAEDGLLGLQLDPNFDTNGWMYLFYSPVGPTPQQYVSRFTFKDGKVDFSSEKVVLVIPVQRDQCCHSGGGLQFDDTGNLFVSVGDNTNPFETPYSPSDNREGKSPWDAGKSSSNMNDLRGKVLRIHPETNGTYTVPDGNLFSKDGTKGKPEIYAMGCRNPFRLSWDRKRKFLYWGDVGPDAAKDSSRGPRGYDEVNQARKPGYFGWPYFIANNKPYEMVDFNTGKYLGKQNPEAPVNVSPNNTGLKQLPPAQPAFIYYPYADSPEFPSVGKGGRNAMAGPVYYAEDFDKNSTVKFPEYFEGKQIIYDWMRGWIKFVTLYPNGDFKEMEPFMPNTVFSNPTDMQFAKDGSLYVIEYGYTWFGKDPNAKLIRITYEAGNRSPIAKASADKIVGKEPLTVHFSSKGTQDYDEDILKYEWNFDGQTQSSDANPVFTFTKPGIFHPSLTVTDPKGKSSTIKIEVKVGNNPPEINFATHANKTFYFDNETIDYHIQVSDKDEDAIDESKVKVTLDYLPVGHDKVEIEAGHKEMKADDEITNSLILGSTCKACHKLNAPSIGPSFVQVANRYRNDKKAPDYLAKKIISGGGGVWGEHQMSAHPQIARKDVDEMVKYILSLSSNKEYLPLTGTFKAQPQSQSGKYYLTASYHDKGTPEIGSLMTTESWILRNPKVEAEDFDKNNDTRFPNSGSSAVLAGATGSYIMFKSLDLSGIKTIGFQLASSESSTIEIRTDKPDGELLASLPYEATGSRTNFKLISSAIKETIGTHDLYFVFVKKGSTANVLGVLDWIEFGKGKDESKGK